MFGFVTSEPRGLNAVALCFLLSFPPSDPPHTDLDHDSPSFGVGELSCGVINIRLLSRSSCSNI